MAKGSPKLQRIISFRLAEFEGLFKQGWTYQMVVDSLESEGVKLTVRYFSQCLAIARAEKAAQEAKGGSVAAVQEVKSSDARGGAQQGQSKAPLPASPSAPAQNGFKMRTLSKDELF